MFDKVKTWTMNVLERKSPNELESCTDFNYYPSEMDPRELPRPLKRYPSLELLLPPVEEKPCSPMKRCTCHNCRELVMELMECPICAGGYQSGVTACDHCGNVICWPCADKIPSCPFCRRPRPLRINTALERIFSKLQLPCHIAPRPERTTESPRKPDTAWCIAKSTCQWTGGLGALAGHLETHHEIPVLVGSGITIEIKGFRSKLRASVDRGRVYTVSLACYASIFVLNVSLYNKKMRLLFTGASTDPSQKFGACLQVGSSYKTMRGILSVSTGKHLNRPLNISCAGFLSPWRFKDDDVFLNINIQPLS